MEQYNVTGMSCAACQTRVEKAVSKVPGVTSCAVSLLTNSMGVEGTASPAEIIAAVENAGYGASKKGEKGSTSQSASTAEYEEMLKDKETPVMKRRLLSSVLLLIPLMYFSMGSILSDVEALSHASLFWRSFSHWIGGMGVLVFILALLPMKGGSVMNLMKAESPGPTVSKFVPRVRGTAKILYQIYLGMTLFTIVALLLSGMKTFDSVTLAMGAAGTGGFAVLNSGCAVYTPLQQWILTIAMIAFGVNFNFYYLMLCKKGKAAISSQEVRAYFLIILLAGGVISWNTYPMYHSIGEAVRTAFFQVGSIITTTGYSTTDFDLWPELSKCILVMLMFIGACAGSTGGGIKVSRILILLKTVKKELGSIVHPRSIKRIRFDDHPVEHEVLRAINVFLIVYLVIYSFSMLIISIDGFSFETNFTAVAATLNNIGPGLDQVGPTSNFFGYSPVSKLILIFDMLAGRLELFPMLILFYPSTWKKRG